MPVDPSGHVPYMSVLRANAKVTQQIQTREAPTPPPTPRDAPQLVERIKALGINSATPGALRS